MRLVVYDQLKGQKLRLLVFNKKACLSRLYNITQSRMWSWCKKPCSRASEHSRTFASKAEKIMETCYIAH